MVQTAATSHLPTRKRERQRAILEAASRLFRRRGLHATGMRDIAAELDMAVGNLYYYFTDKHELLAFCQEDALDGLLALAERVAELDASPEDRLTLLVLGHLDRLHEGTPGTLAHLEVEALEGRWREAIIEQRDRYEAAVAAVVAEGVECGRFRPVDAALATRAMLGSLNWTVKWFDPAGPQTLRELGERLAEIHVGGLLADDAPFSLPDQALLDAALEPDATAEDHDAR